MANNGYNLEVELSKELLKRWDGLWADAKIRRINNPANYKIKGGRLLLIDEGPKVVRNDKIFVPKSDNLPDDFKVTVMLPAHGKDGQDTYVRFLKETKNFSEVVYLPDGAIIGEEKESDKVTLKILEQIDQLALYKGKSVAALNTVGGSNGGSDAVRFEIEAIKQGFTGGSIILFDPSNRGDICTSSGEWVTPKDATNGLDYRFTDEDLKILADNNVPIIIFDPVNKNATEERYKENIRRFAEAGIDMYYIPKWPYDHNDPKFIVEGLKLGFVNGKNLDCGEHKIDEEGLLITKFNVETGKYEPVNDKNEIIELFRNSGMISDDTANNLKLTFEVSTISEEGIVSDDKLLVIRSMNLIINNFNSINFNSLSVQNDPIGISGLISNCVSKYNECGTTLSNAIAKVRDDAMYISEIHEKEDKGLAESAEDLY